MYYLFFFPISLLRIYSAYYYVRAYVFFSLLWGRRRRSSEIFYIYIYTPASRYPCTPAETTTAISRTQRLLTDSTSIYIQVDSSGLSQSSPRANTVFSIYNTLWFVYNTSSSTGVSARRSVKNEICRSHTILGSRKISIPRFICSE